MAKERKIDHDYVDAGDYRVDECGVLADLCGGPGNMGNNMLDLPYPASAEARGPYDKMTDIEPGRRDGMSIQRNQSRIEKRQEARREPERRD